VLTTERSTVLLVAEPVLVHAILAEQGAGHANSGANEGGMSHEKGTLPLVIIA
jgi:hypothetical protein